MAHREFEYMYRRFVHAKEWSLPVEPAVVWNRRRAVECKRNTLRRPDNYIRPAPRFYASVASGNISFIYTTSSYFPLRTRLYQ